MFMESERKLDVEFLKTDLEVLNNRAERIEECAEDIKYNQRVSIMISAASLLAFVAILVLLITV